MKKNKISKKASGKARRYRLRMTFTEQDMRDIREEVSGLMEMKRLDTDRSKLDRLIYSAAWTFSQVLVKIDARAARTAAKKGGARGA